MATTTTKLDKKRIFVSPDRILEALHTKDMSQADFAKAINVAPSIVSRGLRSPAWLRSHLNKIATVLRKRASDLCVPVADIPASSYGGPVVESVCGHASSGGYELPAGCVLRLVRMNDEGTCGWYLLAPRSRKPTDNELVAVLIQDEPETLRRYNRDADDQETLVLQSLSQNGRPRVIKRSLVRELRVAIAPVVIREKRL